jgi:hypothetical protein
VPDAAERLAFTACLAAVADDATSPIRLVLSIRSDFLDRVLEDPRFMAELSQGLVFLHAPGVEGLKDAIVQPAELAGFHFESPRIVEDMLGHLSGASGALPLLQFCATKLWDHRDRSRQLLTQAAYDGIGGVAGALASHADAVLRRVPPQSVPLVRAIFLRLVTPDRTRAIVPMEELLELSKRPRELQSLVDELVAARLLVVETGGSGRMVELVHESLMHTWPTLKRWLEESGEDEAFLAQVRSTTRHWQQTGRDANLLWRGALADEAARFLARYHGDIGDAQREFLLAVTAQRTREARVRRAWLLGGGAFLAVLLTVSWVALAVIQRARAEAQTQASAALSAEAEARANLAAAQRKEQERAQATAQAEKANAELSQKQRELVLALEHAQTAANAARAAEHNAKTHASEALDARQVADEARARADKARGEVADLLARERDRAKRLEEQLGSAVIDTLK